jgi:hypothetical protein
MVELLISRLVSHGNDPAVSQTLVPPGNYTPDRKDSATGRKRPNRDPFDF